MAPEAGRTRPPEDIDPLDFFTHWVPETVARDASRRRKLGSTCATVVFQLQGEGGGIFSVRIENGSVEGSAGDAVDADLRVSLDLATWRELNRGSLSAPEALLRRRVVLAGDFILGLKLHLILG